MTTVTNITNMRFVARSLEDAYGVLFRIKFPILIYPYHSLNLNYHGVVVENVSELKKHFAGVQKKSAVNAVVIDKIKE
ncbi:MAG: hypothetical protein AAB756_01425 [Patescibacteria group bacterium]